MPWEFGQPTRAITMERHVVISQRELRDYSRAAILAAILAFIVGFILGIFAHNLFS